MYTFYKLAVAILHRLQTETTDLGPSLACDKPWCILASQWHNVYQPPICCHLAPTAHVECHSVEH